MRVTKKGISVFLLRIVPHRDRYNSKNLKAIAMYNYILYKKKTLLKSFRYKIKEITEQFYKDQYLYHFPQPGTECEDARKVHLQ